MDFNETKVQILRDYFCKRDDVAFAFLFGSAAKGRIRKEGDVDIAVYFIPGKEIEWEVLNKRYEGENRIGLDVERLLNKDVDLIVLNRAAAVLADEIIRRGKAIMIKDRSIFWDFLCIVSDEAEYVRDWMTTSYKEGRLATNR
jgi:predicted nucleotidyltransferase